MTKEKSYDFRVMIGLDNKLSIREVAYNEDKEITDWTMFAIEIYADHVEDLWKLHSRVMEAFDMPILMERDLENQFHEAGKASLEIEENGSQTTE